MLSSRSLATVFRTSSLSRSLLRLQPSIVSSTQRMNASNTIINFVPQQEAWVVERMGRFHKILEPGINVLIPIIDQIKYVQSLKEMAIEIPKQEAITNDNVQVIFDAVLYLRVTDPYKASYGVEDPEFAITQLAQTTMRSEVGKITLDTAFKERQLLNQLIVEAMNNAAEPWGLVCLRYEIKTMTMPDEIQKAMRLQVEAERKKRAVILDSEGQRQSAVNVAEGEKTSRILRSEAEMMEKINKAIGVARAIDIEAEARRTALEKVSSGLSVNGGRDAASLLIAEQYVKAFSGLAKESNTLIVPAGAADVSSMVGQAMTVYKQLTNANSTVAASWPSDNVKAPQK